jgi:hypothetical protein
MEGGIKMSDRETPLWNEYTTDTEDVENALDELSDTITSYTDNETTTDWDNWETDCRNQMKNIEESIWQLEGFFTHEYGWTTSDEQEKYLNKLEKLKDNFDEINNGYEG